MYFSYFTGSNHPQTIIKKLLNSCMNEFSSVLVDKSLPYIVKLSCLTLLQLALNGLPMRMCQWNLGLMFCVTSGVGLMAIGLWPWKNILGWQVLPPYSLSPGHRDMSSFPLPMCLPCYTPSPQAEMSETVFYWWWCWELNTATGRSAFNGWNIFPGSS